MRLIFGSDHAGVVRKDQLKATAQSWGHEVEDLGTHGTTAVDYPDIAAAVGKRVVELEKTGVQVRGVLCCGSGIGVSISANKVPAVRAALIHEVTSAHLCREHNDANVICFGERITGQTICEEALRVFIDTPFAGGRHAGRVGKLNALD